MTTDTQELAREAVKADIIKSGKTYEQVSNEIGYPRWLISRVLNGEVKAKYGKAHDCAVALGIKPQSKAA